MCRSGGVLFCVWAAVYYRQQSSIASDLTKYMSDIGGLAARNVQSWIAGRILLVESLASWQLPGQTRRPASWAKRCCHRMLATFTTVLTQETSLKFRMKKCQQAMTPDNDLGIQERSESRMMQQHAKSVWIDPTSRYQSATAILL